LISLLKISIYRQNCVRTKELQKKAYKDDQTIARVGQRKHVEIAAKRSGRRLVILVGSESFRIDVGGLFAWK
jgi:hypothetical protein